ncbi:hypothetical protein MKW92_051536 [Papaver armeniacum]|nr:hypothetical protein MKW92_051536 [Papaver armeniacum]
MIATKRRENTEQQRTSIAKGFTLKNQKEDQILIKRKLLIYYRTIQVMNSLWDSQVVRLQVLRKFMMVHRDTRTVAKRKQAALKGQTITPPVGMLTVSNIGLQGNAQEADLLLNQAESNLR